MLPLAGFGLLLLAPAAPVPAPAPPPKVSAADRQRATEFAHHVFTTVQQINQYRQVEAPELIAGSVRALYEEVGLTAPDDVLRAVRGATDTAHLLNLLIDARVRLGNAAALAGPRSYFVAVNGFRHALDPYSGLANPMINRHVSFDMDFGVGIELDGVSGPRWGVYRVERQLATGAMPPTGTFGPVPKPDDVPSPAAFPWRVKRVIPGSPAQKAGVKPGDTITHLNAAEITPATANKLFAQFATPAVRFDPALGRQVDAKYALTLRRAGAAEPVAVTLAAQPYTPETVFGVMRTGDGKWDCMLDRANKIGYIRVGSIEDGADARFAEMIDDLTSRQCRGLVLDLRWCPGGYVLPGAQIAGTFLKPNAVVAEVRVDRPNPNQLGGQSTYRALPPAAGKCPDLPVAVLVGADTTGGGELIAAALQDHNRCVVIGQRTAGRASLQNTLPAGFGDLQFKLTTGSTLRPNGKPRGRTPDSKPTDPWGVRPDPGLEVPVTPDLGRQLREWTDAHALRPADGREALPFDDPARDPFRAAALAYFRKQLGRAGEEKKTN